MNICDIWYFFYVFLSLSTDGQRDVRSPTSPKLIVISDDDDDDVDVTIVGEGRLIPPALPTSSNNIKSGKNNSSCILKGFN